MPFEIRLQPLAADDLEQAYLAAAKNAPQTAKLWLERFETALQTLDEHPERCALAPEHKRLNREIRQFLFGKRPNVFRVLFVIESMTVRILRIRRASRKMLTPNELADS